MYPYNTTTLQEKSMEKLGNYANKNDEDLLQKDERLKDLVLIAQNDTRKLQGDYAKLMEVGILSEVKNLLQTMYLDEVKHEKLLGEVLYLLEQEGNEEENGDLLTDLDVKNVIESLLLQEMDSATFYRALANSIEGTSAIKDILNEIACNKQTHGTGLTYIFTKYFA
ncbi:MAG: hypothetical protein R3Y53_00125 [Bacillota bacterium]